MFGKLLTATFLQTNSLLFLISNYQLFIGDLKGYKNKTLGLWKGEEMQELIGKLFIWDLGVFRVNLRPSFVNLLNGESSFSLYTILYFNCLSILERICCKKKVVKSCELKFYLHIEWGAKELKVQLLVIRFASSQCKKN